MLLTATLESVLLAAAKPVSFAALRKAFDVEGDVLTEAVADIRRRFNTDESGIHLLEHEGQLQFVTNPACAEPVAAFLKQDAVGELTRPSLETLTVIAYRGPITKPELEQIRGVNCALILRNLSMRGLIEERDDVSRLQPVFSLSSECMRALGLHGISELPDYEAMHNDERIARLISELSAVTPVV